MKRARGRSVRRVGLSRFLQWRFNTIAMRWLPRTLVRAYLGLLGRIYFFFSREEKEEIKRNLSAVIRRFPKKQPVDLIIRRTFDGIFAHYNEMGKRYEQFFVVMSENAKIGRASCRERV